MDDSLRHVSSIGDWIAFFLTLFFIIPLLMWTVEMLYRIFH